MPTAELGWWDEDGTLHPDTLIRYGPSNKVVVAPHPDPSQAESLLMGDDDERVGIGYTGKKGRAPVAMLALTSADRPF